MEHIKLKKMALTITEKDIKIPTPFRMSLIGASGSGKTSFILKLIEYEERMLDVPCSKILYFYTVSQPKVDALKNNRKVFLYEGYDHDLVLAQNSKAHTLVIIDDHMTENIYKDLAELFAIHSRHRNISVAFLTQSAYFKGADASKYNREILINSSHTVLFRNMRDRHGIVNIGRAAFPTKMKFYMSCVDDAMKDPYGYLFIAANAEVLNHLRLRTNIFFPEEVPIVYWEK